MGDSMAHRGPDGEGSWISDNGRLGLAHRRLAIIDLSDAAAQPMHDTTGELSIVFNGEIYNHVELRRELEADGVLDWRTDHSDTEVVLNAYRHWGKDCVNHFRGAFTFALWDSGTQELWLVRDRIGVKPLYYSQVNGDFAFGSEIKAILEYQGGPSAVDEEALSHYLTFMVAPAPRTLFSGISKLPPGHSLTIRHDASSELKQWWDVWDHVNPLTTLSEEAITERLLAELQTAVDYRKVSDRPVGVFLSGGVDSSTNTALFCAGETAPVKTFTVGYAGDDHGYENEVNEARFVADELGSEHHETLLKQEDLINFLPAMVDHQDEPISDPVCIPLYYVSKLAREQGVVVCQVGEGADELFHGYPAWIDQRRVQRLSNRIPGSIARHATATALRWSRRLTANRVEYLERAARHEPTFLGGVSVFTEREKARLLSSSVRSRIAGLRAFDAIRTDYERFQEAAWDRSDVNWMTYADLKLRLPELLLMRVDKMSMAVGLEARVPFLDHEFVTFAMSIPSGMKVGGATKGLLKNAVRGIVPDEVIDRPKQGFGVPSLNWIPEIMKLGGREIVMNFSERSGLLDSKGVKDVLDSGDVDRAWVLLNLALWWERHFGDREVVVQTFSGHS
jgi:asparagine synthase (glutamine-hydrolysing)